MGIFKGRMNVQYVYEPGCIVSNSVSSGFTWMIHVECRPLHCLEAEIAKLFLLLFLSMKPSSIFLLLAPTSMYFLFLSLHLDA